MKSASFALLVMVAAFMTPVQAADNTDMSRGKYLTRIGDCRACHTVAGQAAFAGGRPIETPFGVVYGPNITPDPETGIGAWTFADFYRSMHEGLDKNGDYLYPAFPFPAYTHLTRDDVKAIWDYLQTVEPVRRADKLNELRWPYRWRSLMGLWRRFYFEPGTFKPDPDKSETVNRGAYLVRGLAHCGACHTPRNRLGATLDEYSLAGGSVPIEGWFAPNITPNPYIGIGDWSASDLKTFLTTGSGEHGAALGPMRDLIQTSLQYLTADDLDAIVAYVRQVPALGPAQPMAGNSAMPPAGASGGEPMPGAALYHKHCAGCHGDAGRAKHDVYPDLRDNPIVLQQNPANLLQIMLHGGFKAATQSNPYPYSMPPFGFKLNNKQISKIANYVRRNWQERNVPLIPPSAVDTLR